MAQKLRGRVVENMSRDDTELNDMIHVHSICELDEPVEAMVEYRRWGAILYAVADEEHCSKRCRGDTASIRI